MLTDLALLTVPGEAFCVTSLPFPAPYPRPLTRLFLLPQDADNMSLAQDNWRKSITGLSWSAFGLFTCLFAIYAVKVTCGEETYISTQHLAGPSKQRLQLP